MYRLSRYAPAVPRLFSIARCACAARYRARTTFCVARLRSAAVVRSWRGWPCSPTTVELTPPLLTRARLPVGFGWTRPTEGVIADVLKLCSIAYNEQRGLIRPWCIGEY